MTKNADMNNAQNSREPELLSNEDLSQVAGGDEHDPIVNFPCGLCDAPRTENYSFIPHMSPICDKCEEEEDEKRLIAFQRLMQGDK